MPYGRAPLLSGGLMHPVGELLNPNDSVQKYRCPRLSGLNRVNFFFFYHCAFQFHRRCTITAIIIIPVHAS